MSNVLGRKTPPKTERARQQRVELSKRVSAGQIRFGKGRFASAESVKQALSERVGAYLERLDRLARESTDERITFDAGRYLIDRVAGRPTERQQVEQLPVTYQAPSDTQFRELAGRIQGDGARGPNGERGADPDGDGVSADSVAETQ